MRRDHLLQKRVLLLEEDGQGDGRGDRLAVLHRGRPGRHGLGGSDGRTVERGVQRLLHEHIGHFAGLSDGEFHEDLAFHTVGLGGL